MCRGGGLLNFIFLFRPLCGDTMTDAPSFTAHFLKLKNQAPCFPNKS